MSDQIRSLGVWPQRNSLLFETELTCFRPIGTEGATPQPGGDNRESVLHGCLADMVQMRRLRTARTTATATGETKALAELLSRNVLTEWQSSPTGTPDRQLLAFAHNVPFDFGAEYLYLKEEPEDFVKQMQ